jgi:dipeptidyl aminopeptidase/acylaminoacyl peptidase
VNKEGTENMKKDDWEHLDVQEQTRDMLGRFAGLGANIPEVVETIARIGTFGDWCAEFLKLGQSYEERGDAASDAGEKAENYRLAVAYCHIGQLLVHVDTEEKKDANKVMASAYLKAMDHLPGITRRVEIPFEDISLAGYFRQPAGATGPLPCVVLIGGADSSKEAELHHFSELLLAHQVCTLAFDGPGQTETRFRGMYMRPDFEKATSAVLDWLEGAPEVDMNRVGLLGPSFGGYLAPRSAAFDQRVKACVSLGGFSNLGAFAGTAPIRAVRSTQLMFGVSDSEEWRREIRLHSLEDVIEGLTCELLVVNGSNDQTLPVSQSIEIYNRAVGPKELKIYEGASHCAASDREAFPYLTKWIAEKLLSSAG